MSVVCPFCMYTSRSDNVRRHIQRSHKLEDSVDIPFASGYLFKPVDKKPYVIASVPGGGGSKFGGVCFQCYDMMPHISGSSIASYRSHFCKHVRNPYVAPASQPVTVPHIVVEERVAAPAPAPVPSIDIAYQMVFEHLCANETQVAESISEYYDGKGGYKKALETWAYYSAIAEKEAATELKEAQDLAKEYEQDNDSLRQENRELRAMLEK